MTFESLYASPWHDTAIALVTGVVVMAALARTLPFLHGWLALFIVEIMADACLNGGWSPFTLTHHEAPQIVPVAFVILGDARYFILAERYLRAPLPGQPTPALAWLHAAAWSLLVPIGTFVALKAWPVAFGNPRHFFLLYEVCMVAVLLVWRTVVLPRRQTGVPTDTARWIRSVTDFVLVQYALWALADVLILKVGDVGFGLRLIPNVMYYAAFLPAALALAPRGIRPGAPVGAR